MEISVKLLAFFLLFIFLYSFINDYINDNNMNTIKNAITFYSRSNSTTHAAFELAKNYKASFSMMLSGLISASGYLSMVKKFSQLLFSYRII